MASTILPVEVGWFSIIGLSIIFAIATILMIRAEKKYLGTIETSEWFTTAGRNVKTYLMAAAVTSAWTWPAAGILGPTLVYNLGIGGAFWFAAGASVQMMLFSILAVELKRKAPNAHTFLEIIRVRFGTGAHKVFIFFALMTNVMVTALITLGGAAIIGALTGVDIAIAAVIIPIGVMIYTLGGGLKGTFIADYFNTATVYIGVAILTATVYFFSPAIGGIDGLFEKVTVEGMLHPVEGNNMGSFLTLASAGALSFGVINFVGNFGGSFGDQAYWQRAIAAKPGSSVKAFILGGVSWFSWPFALGTALGLAGLALGVGSILTPTQIDLGFVGPTVAGILLGPLGGIIYIAVIFTALTSTGSAELVAVSSIITYDIYRTYKKPNATGKEVLKLTKLVVITFGIGMGGLALILFGLGLSLGYIYLMLGIVSGPVVVPIALSILWKNTNGKAAWSGSIAGLIVGVVAWLAIAQAIFGEVTISSTSDFTPLIWGNTLSITVAAAITFIGSLIRPQNYDWKGTRDLITVVDEGEPVVADNRDNDENALRSARRLSIWGGGIMTVIILFVWPVPLILSGYVFELPFMAFWADLGFLWVLFVIAVCVAMPIVESRKEIAHVLMRKAPTISVKKKPEAE